MAASRLSRRSLLAGGLASTALTALAGCGGRAASPATTLNVWGGVPAESGPADLIAAFEEAHPEYTVNYTRFINDDRGNLKLDTALQGGVDIDVYITYPMESLALRSGSGMGDRKSTRLNSSHVAISYAVFCLKKKIILIV